MGKVEANTNCGPPIKAGTIPLQKVPLPVPSDLDHKHSGYQTARESGQMNGFLGESSFEKLRMTKDLGGPSTSMGDDTDAR